MKPDDLWHRLETRRLLSDPRVNAALRDVPMHLFVDPPLAAVVPLDAPVASAMQPPRAILPPPRLLASLLEMLELERGVSVLLLGSSGGYVEALLAQLVEPARVTVWEDDPALAAVARARLGANGFGDRVAFTSPPADELRFDRITTTDQVVRIDEKARGLLADMGFAVYRTVREAPLFVKLLRSGAEYLELGTASLRGALADRLRAAKPGESVYVGTKDVDVPPAGPPSDGSIGRELILGRLLENAWDRREESPHDRQSADVVDDTFAKAADLPPMSADGRRSYDAAKILFHLAYVYQMAGEFEAAVDLYRASLAVRPTAEAHTFLGWVCSFEDRYDDAIAECERAIAVDPAFGNPYNDIGAYLIERNRLDEAIPWLEKAKAATRYCCYFYPYSNLGRVYMMKGMQAKARREFEEALRINPQYEYAREMLRRLKRGSDYIA